MGLRPISSGAAAPAVCSAVAGVMGWIDGWASGHNPLRSSQGLEGIMIRCVGAALRGDGNPPEFPLYALSIAYFVRITGYGCPHQAHECRTLCAQMPCLPNDFAKQSIVSYRWASPVYKCTLPTSEDLYLDSEKGMMVLSSGRCAPCSLASSIEDSTSRPSELRKRTLVLVLDRLC